MQPYLIGTLLARGVPLLWQGQELMENYWLPEQGRARVALLRPMRWQYFYGDIGKGNPAAGAPAAQSCGRERTELRSGEVYFFNDPCALSEPRPAAVCSLAGKRHTPWWR